MSDRSLPGELAKGLSQVGRAAFDSHVLSGTSPVYLADWLNRAGHTAGPNDVVAYRRWLEAGI